MFLNIVRRSLTFLLIVMLPATLFSVDSAKGMLYAHGATWVNGTSIPKLSAIFPGDMVQTRAGSAATINTPGSSVVVLDDSLIQFADASITLQHGGIAVSTSKSMATRAGEVTISPAAAVWTEFDVKDTDGLVRIAARKGELTIADNSGTTVLQEGQQTTRDENGDDQNKKKRKKNGAVVPPAGQGPILANPLVGKIAIGAVAGVTTWVLLEHDDPASPTN
jgi:hypothetical protein